MEELIFEQQFLLYCRLGVFLNEDEVYLVLYECAGGNLPEGLSFDYDRVERLRKVIGRRRVMEIMSAIFGRGAIGEAASDVNNYLYEQGVIKGAVEYGDYGNSW